MIYSFLIKPLLFLLPAERAHQVATHALRWTGKQRYLRKFMQRQFSYRSNQLEKQVMGLRFRNPIGLAAGFDKNADYIEGMSALGFGFLEVGTVTPRAQQGNPKPRLFRLVRDRALINRMGFNNAGVKHVVKRLKKRRTQVVIGGNIGKNKSTPNEEALQDYIQCFEQLFNHVDYFVVNVSSPNTPGLRDLQDKAPLLRILDELSQRNLKKVIPKPILLKIAPDLSETQLDDIVEIVVQTGISGVIATNTTIGREGLTTSEKTVQSIGNGGLSGAPLLERSLEVVAYLRDQLPAEKVIIGVGGITSKEAARSMLKAGADLIQIYTGLVYHGPGWIKQLLKALDKEAAKHQAH